VYFIALGLVLMIFDAQIKAFPNQESTHMDITTSFFWQNVLLFALLVPYFVGIGISTYYTNRQARSDGIKVHRTAMHISTGEARNIGRLIAAGGATLLALVFSATSIVAVAWAFVRLLGLPDFILWGLLALGAIPVIWVTLWTAGRTWQVEQLLEKGHDADQPAFELGAYLSLPFVRRRPIRPHDHGQ
jgi:hypothetical protein